MKKEIKIYAFTGLFLYTALMLSFTYIFDFDGLYGQDSYDYLLQSKRMFSEEASPGFWPPLFPLLGKLLSLGFLPLNFSLQLLSIFSIVLSGFLLFQILQKLYPEKQFSALFVTGFFLLAPFVLRSGLLVMSDSLAMVLILATFRAVLLKESQWRLPLVFLFAAMAILTRYACAVLLFPLLLVMAVESIRKKDFVSLSISSLAFCVPLIINFFYWSLPEGNINHNWLLSWSAMNFFRSDFNTAEGILNYPLPNFVHVFKVIFYPGFCLISLFLIPFFRKGDLKENRNPIFLFCFLSYAVFLLGIPYQNERFLLLLQPIWLILAYPAFGRMMEAKAFFRNLLVPAAIVLSFFLIYRAMLPVVSRNKLEREIAEGMNTFQGQTLYAFDIDVALQGRGLEMNYVNLWKNELDTFRSGALVLFNEEQFRKQWSGKNPMINYLRMKESGRLFFIRNFSGGWQLWRLQ